tara:strand:- start:3385 stop:4335 length:951 start_codon:yes stop_codon:yes gene_type:complete
MNSVEILREQIINHQLSLQSIKNKSWKIWKKKIDSLLTPKKTAANLLDLGDHLSEIFFTTNSGRSQSGVARAGTAWETIVCWYLNLCTIGTRTVAVKSAFVPKPLRDAMTVRYGNVSSNTEADIVTIVFPDKSVFTANLPENFDEGKEKKTKLFRQDKDGNSTVAKASFKRYLEKHTEDYLKEFQIGIIQCKSNWNDNAQIPMLWDIVYKATKFKDVNISVGRNNFSIKDLKKFSYSFVTVPTQKTKKTKYTPKSTAVLRVNNLSGGNYWGKKSESAVASSIKEIFNKNFSDGLPNMRKNLNIALKQDHSYFFPSS